MPNTIFHSIESRTIVVHPTESSDWYFSKIVSHSDTLNLIWSSSVQLSTSYITTVLVYGIVLILILLSPLYQLVVLTNPPLLAFYLWRLSYACYFDCQLGRQWKLSERNPNYPVIVLPPTLYRVSSKIS